MKSELKVTALASLLAIAGVAHAQSSVTLYGTIDSGLLWQNTAAANFLPVASKNPNLGHVVRFKDGGLYSSLWGLKGTEDIGGGYKINFKLQGVFNTTNGKSILW